MSGVVTGSSAFSSDAENVITRKIETFHPKRDEGIFRSGEKELRHYYEIDKCLEFIKRYHKVN